MRHNREERKKSAGILASLSLSLFFFGGGGGGGGGVGFRVWGFGFSVEGLGLRVQGLIRVSGLGLAWTPQSFPGTDSRERTFLGLLVTVSLDESL